MGSREPPEKPAKAPTKFGLRLKAARLKKQLSQEDLGLLLGMSRATIAMTETGQMPSFECDYDQLAAQLGDTAAEWADLAEKSRQSFHLKGQAVTEEHRRTGAVLEKHWGHLSEEILRVIRTVVLSSAGAPSEGTEPPPAAGSKGGKRQ